MTDSRTIPRREFLKTAVAIGGLTVFAACLEREQVDITLGPSDLSSYPRRQHAWNEVLPADDYGNPIPPHHRVLLYLNYEKSGQPSAADRDITETALRGVEHAYERTGDGLLLTMSYSPAYFDRFDESLPKQVDLPEPEALAPFEEPQLDTSDAVVHLASNHAQVVLGTENALTGNQTSLNGVAQPEATLTDVFQVTDRRTGFVGAGLPANHDDVEGVPEGAVSEDAPLFMGFKSGFTKNQASEARVTIRSGPFAGGATQHISKLRLNLHQWYEQDSRWQRVAISGILKRDGDLVFDDVLRSTIDPDLRYHYGASIADVQSGDELIVTVDTPPQIARHEGYETAFFEMSEMTISL